MAKIRVRKCTNANVYLNGTNLLGRAEEITLPEVKAIMADHKALGMVGTGKFFSGIEELTAKFKWISFYPEVMLVNANPTKGVVVQVRASVEEYTSMGRIAEEPFVAFLTGCFASRSGGDFKQHENVQLPDSMTIYAYKEIIAGVTTLDVDVLSNIWIAGGVDMLATYRANIGG